MKKIPRFIFYFLIIVNLAFFLGIVYATIWAVNKSRERHQVSDEVVEQPVAKPVTMDPLPTRIAQPTETEVVIKNKYSLDVPFIVQAPFANWDARHEESCEEASLIMVKYFKDGTRVKNLNAGDQDLNKLLDWEDANSYKVDVTLKELSQIAKDYYGMKTGRIIKNPSVNDLKKEITQGRPIIVPAAGKILPNPSFRNGGPKYHMLVIKGYDEKEFITNDPGTRNGDGFRYTYDGLMNAIHDWNQQDIMLGQRAVLVFD